MANTYRPRAQRGFTLVEVTVSLIIGALLLTALYRMWTANHDAAERIGNKADFRNRATLATTQLNRSITMAGYGMTKMDVLFRARAQSTDTLIVYSNPLELQTTLRDTAFEGSDRLVVFKDTGFAVGSRIAITDSLRQEFAIVSAISGDSAQGYTLTLSEPIANTFVPGVPDIYPVAREQFFLNPSTHALIRKVDDRNTVLADGITDFRVDLKDASGNDAASYRTIRVVAFALTGTYKAPEGSFNTMRFSSTVIPRNIL